MADRNIGALDLVPQLDDDSLLVVEQQGQAMKATGAQFKEFGRQAVIGQVQGYVDQAEAAANRAADAVSAVTDMTVEARTLEQGQPATVAKTIRSGKVNLAFGLPRGERGDPGPPGEPGSRGPQGPTGKGLTILGYYDTLADLEAAVVAPEPGDPYGVGSEAPYDIYIFDGATRTWRNNGPLSGGGGGGPLPEDVVTTPGGAELAFSSGDGPHTVAFDFEEEPPLTAEDIEYSDTQTVKEAMEDLFASVSNGKSLIASAITDKGVATAQDAAFAQMAENIGEISTGADTSDATATAFDILAGKTAYTASGKVEGVIPNLLAQTITPGTADKTIANGQYLGGTQTIKGDPNLTSSNIKKGVSLFGVEGALESKFQATLTVKADTGAVVTATHTDGTKVEALSTNGQVVFELPKEGTWKVTAVRGMAQYNTVTIQVTSQYNAELTAEVHIEYYGAGAPLTTARYKLGAVSIGSYALFGGGQTVYYSSTVGDHRASNKVDVYNNVLSKQSLELSSWRYALSAAAVENYALFAGGAYYAYNSSSAQNEEKCAGTVDTFSKSLTKSSTTSLSLARKSLAAASVGNYALFAGGIGESATLTSNVDAYNNSLTRSSPTQLSIQTQLLAAEANGSYTVFAGGSGASVNGHVTAYDASLTRTTPTGLSVARANLAAARAGNYILFAGGGYSGSTVVDAYDLFLTRTTAEILGGPKTELAGTTLEDCALFGGYSTSLDVYDAYLVRTTPTKGLKTARKSLAATPIGNYALFAGGISISNQSYYNNVDIYQYV